VRSEWRSLAGALGLLSQVGLTMVVAVLLGGGLGYAADRHLGLGVGALVAGILLGVAAGAVAVYRLVMGEVLRDERAGAAEDET